MPPWEATPGKTTASSHPVHQPAVLLGRPVRGPRLPASVRLPTWYQTPAQTARRRGCGSRLQPRAGASLGVWSSDGQGPDTGWPRRQAGKRRALYPPTALADPARSLGLSRDSGSPRARTQRPNASTSPLRTAPHELQGSVPSSEGQRPPPTAWDRPAAGEGGPASAPAQEPPPGLQGWHSCFSRLGT